MPPKKTQKAKAKGNRKRRSSSSFSSSPSSSSDEVAPPPKKQKQSAAKTGSANASSPEQSSTQSSPTTQPAIAQSSSVEQTATRPATGTQTAQPASTGKVASKGKVVSKGKVASTGKRAAGQSRQGQRPTTDREKVDSKTGKMRKAALAALCASLSLANGGTVNAMRTLVRNEYDRRVNVGLDLAPFTNLIGTTADPAQSNDGIGPTEPPSRIALDVPPGYESYDDSALELVPPWAASLPVGDATTANHEYWWSFESWALRRIGRWRGFIDDENDSDPLINKWIIAAHLVGQDLGPITQEEIQDLWQNRPFKAEEWIQLQDERKQIVEQREAEAASEGASTASTPAGSREASNHLVEESNEPGQQGSGLHQAADDEKPNSKSPSGPPPPEESIAAGQQGPSVPQPAVGQESNAQRPSGSPVRSLESEGEVRGGISPSGTTTRHLMSIYHPERYEAYVEQEIQHHMQQIELLQAELMRHRWRYGAAGSIRPAQEVTGEEEATGEQGEARGDASQAGGDTDNNKTASSEDQIAGEPDVAVNIEEHDPEQIRDEASDDLDDLFFEGAIDDGKDDEEGHPPQQGSDEDDNEPSAAGDHEAELRPNDADAASDEEGDEDQAPEEREDFT